MSKKNSLLFKGNYLLKYFLGISIVLYKILYSFLFDLIFIVVKWV